MILDAKGACQYIIEDSPKVDMTGQMAPTQ